MLKSTDILPKGKEQRPRVPPAKRDGRAAYSRFSSNPAPTDPRQDSHIREALEVSPASVSTSPRPRQHRTQTKGESGNDDAGDPEPEPEPPPPLQSSNYPAQDPALFAWSAPAPGYDHHAKQLDSLHRLPAVEARPDDETLAVWDWAKCQSLTLAERLQRTVAGMTHAQEIRGCQSYLTFRPTTDGPWAVSDTRRCYLRLCPNDALARARSLRWRLDTLAAGILKHGPLLFLTIGGCRHQQPQV